MAADEDAALMLAFKAGDASAFDVLVERYRSPLATYFYALSRDRDTADDLAQELFVKLYRYRADYEPKAAFRTYVFALARNLWIDAYRSRRRSAGEVSLDALHDDESTALASRLEAAGEQPDQAADRAELGRMIAKAAARLPESLREVFVLGAVQERDYADVAAILEIPVGTVKSRMFHAVRKLRAWLGPAQEPTESPRAPRHEP
jgi:RNA polymerase sigma-70 factor, ECF subfamily